MIWLLLAASTASSPPYEQEREMFTLYHSCVVRAAEAFIPSGESASTIEAASRSHCRNEFSSVEAFFAAHGAIASTVEATNDIRSPYYGHDPSSYMNRFNRELSEDVAKLVVTSKMQAMIHAPNR